MKWYKKPVWLMLILIILFVIMLVSSHWVYDTPLNTIIQIVGSMFGILVGSFLAGIYTLHSTEKQLAYDKASRLSEEKEKILKIKPQLIRYFKLIGDESEHLSFLIDRDLQEFNVHGKHVWESHVENIKREINSQKESLDRLPADYIPVHLFEKIQTVNSHISQISMLLPLYFTKSGDNKIQVDKIQDSIEGIKEEIKTANSRLYN